MSRVAAAVGFGVTIAFAVGAFAALAAGCAGPSEKGIVVASVERKFGGEIRDAKTRPCVRSVPPRPKIVGLADPERLAYLDENHEPRDGMRITVDAASIKAFFGYVESLEAIAQKALGCLARP